MKSQYRLAIICWVILAASACSQNLPGNDLNMTPSAQVIATQPQSKVTIPVVVTTQTSEFPVQFRTAREELSQGLGISSSVVILESYQSVDWPDSCLGVQQPGIACLDVITPGYLAIFNTPSGAVEVHTSIDGSLVRIVPQGSGIQGQALVGPACPGPVHIDTPCPDMPYAGYLMVLDQAGNTAAEIQTKEDGSFQLALPPGTYRITTPPGKPLPSLSPLEVKVEAGQYTTVQLHLDSGMR